MEEPPSTVFSLTQT